MPPVFRRFRAFWNAAYIVYVLAFAGLLLLPAGSSFLSGRGFSWPVETAAFGSVSPESLSYRSSFQWLATLMGSAGIRARKQPWKPTGVDYGNTDVPLTAQGKPVCLAWQYNPSKLTAVPTGVNVLAPRWFFVESVGGSAALTDLGHRADSKANMASWNPIQYVQEAHEGGAEVWAQVMSFTPKLSKQIVSDGQCRNEFISGIASYVVQYNLDGIDFDFEDMDPKDASKYTDLIAGCKQALPPGITLCVDVTVPLDNPSPTNWYQCYDRVGIGKVADYVAVMTYQYSDLEPVADIEWVRGCLEDMLAQVPAGKILMGVPFYGTNFQVEDLPAGDKLTSFPDVGKSTSHWNVFPGSIQSLLQNGYYMSGSKKIEVDYWIEKGVWSEQSGATRYSFVDKNGWLDLIYIDDAQSLLLKGGLMDYKRLGGVAVWQMSYGTDDMWNSLAKGISGQ
jgi:spore germination protein YaaH